MTTDTNAHSLQDHCNYLEDEIFSMNRDYGQLRQTLYVLKSDLLDMEKRDSTKRKTDEAQINAYTQKLYKDLNTLQSDHMDSNKDLHGQINRFEEETANLNKVLDELERKLGAAEDKIGMIV